MSRSIATIVVIVIVAFLLIIGCGFISRYIYCRNNNCDGQPTAVPVVPSPLFQVQPQPNTYNAAGQVITFTYSINNNGVTSLPGPVTVNDNIVKNISCPDLNTIGNKNGNLDVGEVVACTGQYTTTQTDVDNTMFTSVATATIGTQTVGPVSTTVKVPLNPVLKLTVSPNPNGFSAPGQNINFTYTITNTGTTNLSPAQFTVRDSLFPNTITCGPNPTTLGPNQSVSCNATYTTNQADVTAGKIVSNAIASGAGAGVPQQVATTVTFSPTPITTVVPITPGSMITHVVTPGDWLLQISRCYGASFHAVETANPQVIDPDVIFPNTIVKVPNVGSAGTIYGPPCMIWYPVESGNTWQSIATAYNADIDIMKAANPTVTTLTVGIKIKVPVNSKGGPPVTPAPTTPVPPPAILTLSVSPTPNTYTAAGQSITLNYTITNAGSTNAGPTQFIVRDSLFPNAINCGMNGTILAPNQTVTCNAVYTTTQADVTTGKIVSNATALGAAGTSQTVVTTIQFITTVPTTAVPQTIRLTFPAGNPAQLSQPGTINTPGTIRYVFAATTGQTLAVQLIVPTNDVNLAVYAPNGTVLKPLDLNLTWSGTLPQTGDYSVDLVSSVGSAAKAYTLNLTLNTPITTVPSNAEQVVDIYPGSGSSNPSYLSPFNGQLYFQANANNGAGPELWKFDAGLNAASMVADIYPGATGSEPAYMRPYKDNMLYFSANGNDNAGIELWRFNGSATGRVNDLFPGQEGSRPSFMTEFNGLLYFSANGNDGAGVELWRFDGNNTTRAADINPGPGNSNPSYLAVYNNALYFAATTTNGGTELWKFDGNTASLASDITPGLGNGNPAFLAVFNNLLYFSANGNNGAGTELWKFDGTNSSMAVDINPGANDSAPTYMTVFNNALFFGANGNNAGFELWKFDGTNASMAADINPTGSSNPAYLAVYNNQLYFQATGNSGAGAELWRYKGP